MNLLRKSTVLLFPLLLAVGFYGSGCSSTPKVHPVAWNLEITKRTTASIEADLIGVTSSEKNYYQGVTMDEYWKADSQVRRDADKISKDLQKDQPWIITRDDPKWKEWLQRNVTELLLVARLPEPNGLWKVSLPLDKKAWDAEKKTVKVEIKDARISIQTPQR